MERIAHFEKILSDENARPEKIEMPIEVFDNEANNHFYAQPRHC